jgi:hypothetical protein
VENIKLNLKKYHVKIRTGVNWFRTESPFSNTIMALELRKRCVCWLAEWLSATQGVNYNKGEVSPKLFVKHGERARGIIGNLSLRYIRISKRSYW